MNILKAMVAIIDNNNFRINGERTGTLSRNGKGMEARAPERTETKSGLVSEPNTFLALRSTSFKLVCTSAFNVLG